VIAITSFSPKGYEVYGKKFLESAVSNWPTRIIAYVDEIPDFVHEKVEYKLLSELPNLTAFLAYCDTNPVFSGRLIGGYNFNYDARKFAFKVFAQFDALTRHEGMIFWLDADMVFNKPVPESFLVDVFNEKTIAILIRDGLHAESGFVGFNTKGIGFDHFLDTYRAIYRTGKLFALPQWIDGAAIQRAVIDSAVPYNNLSSDFPKHGINVMPHSILGEYIQHNKGNRKHKAA
jgi:hypothetical protein